MTDASPYQKVFESWGTERVRAELHAGTIAKHQREEAVAWLARQDHASRLRDEASIASERRRSQRIEIATYVAAIAAIVAAIAAVISIMPGRL